MPDDERKAAYVYPDLDVAAQVREARAWCVTNRARRKTAGGLAKFLNGWMGRAKNPPPGRYQGAEPVKWNVLGDER